MRMRSEPRWNRTTLAPAVLLADVNSRLRSLYAIADPSVCRLSVTLVRPVSFSVF